MCEGAWTALRRSMLWGFLIGWMITPVENYGASIQEENLERLTAAVEDYDTLAIIDAPS